MIPQRVMVKGFLSYRDEQEVRFDGGSLWMLAGPNGSGKSAIFDAVTYALFGQHRGGKQNARELVNKESDGLVVELDFVLDGQLYQARRTLRAATNRTTRQIHRWDPAAGAWEAVADTGQEAGFAAWVLAHVGMNYETFTSSVLLLQGKAEKLLAAEPAERFRVLAGVVDLGRYQRLHERADARRREAEARAAGVLAQLEAFPEVADEELQAAERQIVAATEDRASAAAEVERLQSLSLALPLLRRLYAQRENLRRARRQLPRAATKERRATARAGRLEARLARRIEKAHAATAAREQSDHAVTAARTLLQAARERAERFRLMAGCEACDYCGQPLTPEHVVKEQAGLERTLAAAAAALVRAEAEQQRCREAEAKAKAREAETADALAATRADVAESRRQREEAEADVARSTAECLEVYRQLPEPFRSRISPEPPADWRATTFPTAEELGETANGGGPDAENVHGRITAAKERLEACDEALRLARHERDRLLDRRTQRAQLQDKYRAADREQTVYRTLAEHLGRRGLQLHLMRRAERGIVNYANAVLDRLSGGQFCLRLRGGDDDAEQALELEAYDRFRGQVFGLPFLSGSQRFRVAVSLALGVGQYASRQHRPIESVIIDEGFGCLDRGGRQVMIQELQNLRTQLRCVVLVSHQEEFADAFADGYRFELVNGSTEVTRFQR